MNRLPVFDSPFLLGFEPMRALIERAAKTAGEGYPPYNVEDIGAGGVRITLAVAGFSAEQLDVTVEDQQLTITSRREAEAADGGERAFLHRGIAARGFVRGFILADGMQVATAHLGHGLLHVEAARPEAAGLVRRIPITEGG